MVVGLELRSSHLLNLLRDAVANAKEKGSKSQSSNKRRFQSVEARIGHADHPHEIGNIGNDRDQRWYPLNSRRATFSLYPGIEDFQVLGRRSGAFA